MRGNPGKVIELEDGRIVIFYNSQPLREFGKIVLHLIDENFKPVKREDGKNATLIKSIADTDALLKTAKLIGFCD